MAVPTSKDELLTAVKKSFTQLSGDLDRVPPDAARQPVLEGHVKDTIMSPADLVAYLVGWNQQVLTWHRRRAAGLPDEFPAPGIRWKAKDLILVLVEGYTDDDLYGAPWYGKSTMGRMISLNTSSPYANARARIRTWLRHT